MKFHLKTKIVLDKEFDVEAKTLKEAEDIVMLQLVEEIDLNTLEMSSVAFDMTDPTIRQWNGEMCKKFIERTKREMIEQTMREMNKEIN